MPYLIGRKVLCLDVRPLEIRTVSKYGLDGILPYRIEWRWSGCRDAEGTSGLLVAGSSVHRGGFHKGQGACDTAELQVLTLRSSSNFC